MAVQSYPYKSRCLRTSILEVPGIILSSSLRNSTKALLSALPPCRFDVALHEEFLSSVEAGTLPGLFPLQEFLPGFLPPPCPLQSFLPLTGALGDLGLVLREHRAGDCGGYRCGGAGVTSNRLRECAHAKPGKSAARQPKRAGLMQPISVDAPLN
jgi:hypothetical protein